METVERLTRSGDHVSDVPKRVAFSSQGSRQATVCSMHLSPDRYSLGPPILRSGSVGSRRPGSYKPPMTQIGDAPNKTLLGAVGNRIRTLRELKRMEPKDFAEAAGFSLSYLWRLESGQQNLNLKSISRIAIALGEPMSALLEGIDPDPDTLEPRPYVRKQKKAATGKKNGDKKGDAGGDAA